MTMINDPGVNIVSRLAVTPQVPPQTTDTAFLVGITQMGRTDAPVLLRSLQDYLTNFGARVSYGLLYDWLDAFFNEAGGGQVYCQRVVGPAAVVDTAAFLDSGGAASISVTSIGGGTSGLSAAIQAGQSVGSFNIVVTGLPDGSTLISPDLFTPQDAVSWGMVQNLIRVLATGANAPVVHAAVALAGGTDDRTHITDVQRVAAMNLMPIALGPGQVMCPGGTTESVYAGLLTHAANNNRFALLDATDTATLATLTSAAASCQTDSNVSNAQRECGMLCSDWQLIPGLTSTSTRSVPPSAIVAALIARSDRSSSNPNLAAAGANGEVQYALGKTQTDWTDAQITQLVAAGVMPFHMVYGGERFYGFRTLVNPSSDPVYVMASASRLRMSIQNDARIIGQSVLMGQIDGQGQEAAIYGGMISAALLNYFNVGALFGETADSAYIVDVGADVNTPTTIANRELHAAVGIVPSPFAEMVFIGLAAYTVSQPV